LISCVAAPRLRPLLLLERRLGVLTERRRFLEAKQAQAQVRRPLRPFWRPF
jgi:hypothetical protein